MSSISFDNMRVGKNYFIRNFRESTSFSVLESREGDFVIKDLLSMEVYLFSELIRYGKGEDFELKELD